MASPGGPLGRNSDFVKLWSGFSIAVVGSQVTVLALPLAAVLVLGAGATETGLLVAFRMAPSLVVGLFIGAWVDRIPRRPILVGSDIGSAIVIGSIPVAAAMGRLPPPPPPPAPRPPPAGPAAGGSQSSKLSSRGIRS